MEQKILRIKELVKQLNEASKLYYNGKQSKLSDKEWDSMFDELKSLELETNFILNNSPTINVGYETVNELEKVKHTKPMLSLDKTKDVNELKKFLGSQEGVLSWKEDGLTIVLHYNNGKLLDAITRGGGIEGSRILHNAKVFKNIPQTISYKGNLIIRGEGLISKKDFEEINKNGEYKNPRNLASGSIMQLDSSIAKERYLQFKAFGIVKCDSEFGRYTQQLCFLESLGFDTVEYVTVKQDTLEIIVNDFKNHIPNYEFATDGLVLMYNDIQYGEKLGNTSHHENNAIAFKWFDETKETILRDIQFQIGRTGILTPVAIFDPIDIENSMVSKASIHNISILKDLELGINDSILVYKANMIIPQIDENLTRSNTFKLPTSCPCCGGNVEIKSSEQADFLYCTNPDCSAKLSQRIEHYCSKNATNMDGLASSTIDLFLENEIITNISDLYKLEDKKEQILKLPKFGKKKLENTLSSIEKSRKVNLRNFLYALGIPNVGLSTAKDLATNFKNINSFRMCCKEQLLKIKDIGETTSDNIVEWLRKAENQNLINDLLEYIDFIQEEKKEVSSNNVFQGKTVYCTGSFAIANKDQLKQMVEENGGVYASGYAKSLGYLVIGSLKGSSKQSKAEADNQKGANIQILTEEDFLKMIGK